MNYSLESIQKINDTSSFMDKIRVFLPYLKGEGFNLSIGAVVVILSSLGNIITPYFIAVAIDDYISTGNTGGLVNICIILALIYLAMVVLGYLQTRIMSYVSQRVLFRLRSDLFSKVQELPIAFFNQNKAGDLMSRINGDTDRLNQLLTESIARFIGTFFVIFGIGIFILFLNFKLALIALISSIAVVVITRLISPFISRLNVNNLNKVGELGANIEQNLTNFKVIVAFNRRDYLREKFMENNNEAFKTGIKSSIANNIFTSLYDLSSNISQILVLFFGIYFISTGEITIGLLIGFIAYTQRFYEPLRMLGSIVGNIQLSFAAWIRINNILTLKSDLLTVEDDSTIGGGNVIMELDNIYFEYKENEPVLKDINLKFEKGKTYALVGPTGGGKSTTASLMLRLYDPTKGIVKFDGKDIRSYSKEDLSKNIGFIQQDPFLFEGTVGENIRYGNNFLEDKDDSHLLDILEESGLGDLVKRFPEGLSTVINLNGDNISLGQKQLISFIRVLLRKPRLVILDEATANIDTVTEQLLNKIIEKISSDTTKVIIAHRLNTIKNADEILFISQGKNQKAENFENAVELIRGSHSKS